MKIVAHSAIDEGSQTDSNQMVRDWVNVWGAQTHIRENC